MLKKVMIVVVVVGALAWLRQTSWAPVAEAVSFGLLAVAAVVVLRRQLT